MHVYPDLQLSILIIIIDCDSRGLYYTIVGGEPWNHVRLKVMSLSELFYSDLSLDRLVAGLLC